MFDEQPDGDLHGECASEIAALRTRIAELETERERLREALAELHALVMGECPALLDEDSGGSSRLDMLISEALKENDDAIG